MWRYEPQVLYLTITGFLTIGLLTLLWNYFKQWNSEMDSIFQNPNAAKIKISRPENRIRETR
jgi:hypothetical protein